jgi:arylsulfatase A-like enzyme
MSCYLYICLFLISLRTFHCSSEHVKERPNMIFFFPDTLRAESFNSYGNTVPDVTPNFQAFAKEGTRFEQAHVMHTQCSPSRCTMMTGRYMHTLGHRTQIHLIRAYEENYWRLLKESGYHVAWYGKNDALSQAAFNLSVSEWENDIGYDSGHNAFQFGESGYYSMLSTGGKKLSNDTTNGDLKAVQKAIEFMKSNPPEPFAIFLPTRGGMFSVFLRTFTIQFI